MAKCALKNKGDIRRFTAATNSLSLITAGLALLTGEILLADEKRNATNPRTAGRVMIIGDLPQPDLTSRLPISR